MTSHTFIGHIRQLDVDLHTFRLKTLDHGAVLFRFEPDQKEEVKKQFLAHEDEVEISTIGTLWPDGYYRFGCFGPKPAQD